MSTRAVCARLARASASGPGPELAGEEAGEVARRVADPAGQALDALAVDDAVGDQPHRPAGRVGRDVPVRAARRGVGKAPLARAVAGGDNGDPTVVVGQTTHVSPPEREAFFTLENSGVTDVVRARVPEGLFTYWDYKQLRFPRNEGMRIDFILGSSAFAAAVTDASIHRNERKGTARSDHVPVLVDLALSRGRRRPADDLRLSPRGSTSRRDPPSPTGSRKGAPLRLGGYPRRRDHVPQQRARRLLRGCHVR